MTAHTWANGFGVWHVRVNIGSVPEESSGAVIVARKALRDELTARENNVTRDVWMHPVRVPEQDTDGTVVYRERFLDTDGPVRAAVGPGAVPGAHVTTTDYKPADALDSAAHAAFCNTDGCTWRGEWHHEDDPDDPDRAYLDAAADAREHVVETGQAAT